MSRALTATLALLTALGLAACTTGTATNPGAQGTTRSVASSPAPAPGATATGPATTPLPASPARTGPPHTPTQGSGIAGVTTINRCPLVRAETPCPALPVRARMSIVDSATGTVAAAVSSGSDGHFVVAVRPGRYLIRVLAIGAGPPHPQAPVQVTVTAGHYTTVTLRFDSGIR